MFSDENIVTADVPTPQATTNGEEKSEDWLQVGKRNRTHVLRTVSFLRSTAFPLID